MKEDLQRPFKRLERKYPQHFVTMALERVLHLAEMLRKTNTNQFCIKALFTSLQAFLVAAFPSSFITSHFSLEAKKYSGRSITYSSQELVSCRCKQLGLLPRHLSNKNCHKQRRVMILYSISP